MAPPLKGFYYDAERKKYFRILPHHQAPNGAKYSKEALKQSAMLKEKRRKEQIKMALEPDKAYGLQRRSILSHPLLGATGLQRELGFAPLNTQDAPNLAWADGLERKKIVDHFDLEILDFVIDKEIGSLLQLTPGNFEDLWVYAHQPSLPNNNQKRSESMMFGQHFHSSMDLSPSRVLIATSRGDGGPGKIFLTELGDPDEFNQEPRSWNRPLQADEVHVWSDPDDKDWFSSAAKPDPASTVFVVGGSSGVSIIREDQDVWDMEDAAQEMTSASSVDWLDANVVISGNGEGGVRLTDLRASRSALRFQHPAGIVRVKNLGCQQIIVAGLSNSMMSYDIRSPPPQSFSQPTKAYTRFRGYEWGDDPNIALGFDVHENLVVTSDPDQSMTIFDITTGKQVSYGRHGRFWGLGHHVRALKFAPDMWDKTTLDDGYGLRIFAAVGPRIEQWSFSENEYFDYSMY